MPKVRRTSKPSRKRERRVLLCRLGLHKWHKLCRFSLVIPWVELFECLRCHRREARYGYATMRSDAPDGGWQDYLELEAIYDTKAERS